MVEHSDFAWLDKVLQTEGARLRSSVTMTDRDVERLLDAVLLQASATGCVWTPTHGLFVLRQLLQPFCGPGLAKVTIDLALRRSTPPHDRNLAAHHWPVFVSNLTDAVGGVCGLAAARLVGHAGEYLASETLP
jgi:hypothetical protein